MITSRLLPLFSTWNRPLSPDELSTGGIIMFTLKDHDLFGRNDFLGESFLPLESIPFTMSNTKLTDLPQKHLPLTLPKDPNSIILQTLESRQWDKSAAEFVKKERTKMIPSPNAPQWKPSAGKPGQISISNIITFPRNHYDCCGYVFASTGPTFFSKIKIANTSNFILAS